MANFVVDILGNVIAHFKDYLGKGCLKIFSNAIDFIVLVRMNIQKSEFKYDD